MIYGRIKDSIYKRCVKSQINTVDNVKNIIYTSELNNFIEIAFYEAYNSMSISNRFNIIFFLSDNTSEDILKSYIKRLHTLMDINEFKDDINIDVFVNPNQKNDVISISFNYIAIDINVGNSIILIKGLAISSAYSLYKDFEDRFIGKFNEAFIEDINNIISNLTLDKEKKVFMSEKITMYALGNNGIYGALFEISDKSRLGVRVHIPKLFMPTCVNEVCEEFDVNPYYVNSVGGALIFTDDVKKTTSILEKNEIYYNIIGEVIDKGIELINKENNVANLEPVKGNELLEAYRRIYENTNT